MRDVARWWTTEPLDGAKTVSFLAGRVFVTTPRQITEHVREDGGDVISARMVAALDDSGTRIICTEATITRSGASAELSSTDIRRIAIHEALRHVGDEMVEVVGRDGRRVPLTGAGLSFLPAGERERSEVVEDAAQIYLASKLTSRRPLADVARLLRISQSTATRLVAEAREAGLVDG